MRAARGRRSVIDGAPPHVLIIEDDAKIRAILSDVLSRERMRCSSASAGEEGLALAASERPDLVVLDLGLPGMDGLEICRRLREWSSMPIVVLSARHSEVEKAALLDAGADDYITKPFSPVELPARVRAQLRRARMAPVAGAEEMMRIGELTIDAARRSVERDGTKVHLTPTEWGLLSALVRNAGRTMTHRQLFTAVWGPSHGDAQQYLRVYVAHLRKKIEADPLQPRLIVTEPGVGYRFERGE